MPTPNMSDEELDALVRRSAEAYPEEIPLGGWLRMEDKLREAATARLVRRKVVRLFMLEVALMALLLLLWQGYRAVPNAEVAQQAMQAAASVAAKTPAPTPAAPAQLSTSPNSPGSISLVEKTIPTPESIATKAPDKPIVASADVSTTSDFSPNLVAARRRAKTATVPFVAGLTPKQRRVRTASEEMPQDAVARNISSRHKAAEEPDSHQQTNSPADPDNILVSSNGLVNTPAAPSTPQQAELAQQPTVSAATPAKDTLARKPAVPTSRPDSTATKRQRPAHRLVVGILAAPSFSAVRRLETARLGNNLGVSLEYRLTSRLRVRTALIRSIKNYGVASSDYTIPDSWQWRQGNYEVNADCRITEIPLDLRYDVVSRPTYTVFANAGLTSLLMRYECYDYDYQVNGQPRTAVAKVYNGKNQAFGLLNLSGGVERPLGSRWSIQAEPFLQLPLGPVGAGKVRLMSAGTSFSLKYGLLR